MFVKLVRAFVEAAFLFAERFTRLFDFAVEFVSALKAFLFGVELGLPSKGVRLSASGFEKFIGFAMPGAESEPRQDFENDASGEDPEQDSKKDGAAVAKPKHERKYPHRKRCSKSRRSPSKGNRSATDKAFADLNRDSAQNATVGLSRRGDG